MNNITDKYLSTIQENHNYDIARFCKTYGYNNLRDMDPDTYNRQPSIVLELFAVTIVKLHEYLVDEYESEPEKFKFYPDIETIAPFRNKESTPFFSSGYFGIVMNDINNNKFYYMIDCGKVGLEDMRTATATIGSPSSPSIDLTFGESRAFGVAGIKQEDFEKAVDILTEKLIERFMNG